ncbi:MAG: hypothetical protein LBI62_10410 [Candidatus Accumulibacter sp.]|jgi:hypothetical protein|nr:hypothetical protein [Accumulibacter sp.]
MGTRQGEVNAEHPFSLKMRFMTLVMLLVMALLVLCEYRYNLDLLNNISDPAIRPEAAEELSQRGKLLASFGLTWALFRNLLFRFRSVFAGLALLAALTAGSHFALDALYDRVIGRLPPNVKVMGYNLLFYRLDLLKGDLEDPDIPNVHEDPVIGKIFMGAFPMVLLDERFMVPAQAYVIRRADLKVEEALRFAEEKWPQYEKSMNDLDAGYKKFIEWSRKAAGDALSEEWGQYALQMQRLDESFQRYRAAWKMATGRADLAQEWNLYDGQMNTLRANHREFLDGSRRVANTGFFSSLFFNPVGRFRAKSGCLDPDTRLSLSGFVDLLRRSSCHGGKIRAAEARVIGRNADGSPILAKEIPYFLDRPGFEEWIERRAAQGLRDAGLPLEKAMTREQFLDWVRGDGTPGSHALRAHEARNYGTSDHPILGRDIPYFMGSAEFMRWTGHKITETLLAYDMPPDASLSRDEFMDLLRKARSKEGESLREAERRLLVALPDGTKLRIGDVPYFMDRENYRQWAKDEVERLKAKLVPTEENVHEFATINQINASVFVPPMAVVSSLTSALVNAISFLILLLATVLTLVPATRRAGVHVGKFAVPLMLAAFAALVLVMPSHVFRPGTEAWNLESRFHERIGVAAQLWSRLSNVQKLFL